MTIRNRKDFWSAVMFIVFGVLFIAWSTDYQFGTTQRMGPGYFPTVLGIMLVVLGILVGLPAIKADAPETHVEKIGWRGLLVILGAVALYAFLLPRAGLRRVAGRAGHHERHGFQGVHLEGSTASCVVLGFFSYLVFVKGLELQFPVWPLFLTR